MQQKNVNRLRHDQNNLKSQIKCHAYHDNLKLKTDTFPLSQKCRKKDAKLTKNL